MDMNELNDSLELGKKYKIIRNNNSITEEIIISDLDKFGCYIKSPEKDTEYLDYDDFKVVSEIFISNGHFFHNNIYTLHNNLIEAIISRSELENSFVLFDKEASLITIRDPGTKPVSKQVIEYFKNYITIDFWDVEEDFASYKVIDKEKSILLHDFIINNNKFIINCEAGKSRSAGVGMAIECIKNFDSELYFHQIGFSSVKEHPRYIPNRYVYKSIVEAKK